MKVIDVIKKYLHHTFLVAKRSEEINEGILHQSALISRKFNDLNERIKNQSDMLNLRINELVYYMKQFIALSSGEKLEEPIEFESQKNELANRINKQDKTCFEDAIAAHPLLFGHKTYNTYHPDYDAELVRNFPGKIFNKDNDSGNPVYAELKKMIQNNEITEIRWERVLQETMNEVNTVPHANEVFERKAYVDQYIKDLEKEHGAFYQPGWVNLEDAIFLYWIVRKLKPKKIVQTGVCNGLSSAFMMLALAKNGAEGTLHVIDLPFIFDPNDPNWKLRGNVYGVIIPEGKSSGWLVPDAYRDRFEVLNGEAKDLLPGLLKKVGSIDMFFHDSDHTYDHMMFEFAEVKKYLTKHGVIVSDDIAWNASVWDFADEYKVPAYNYRGSMGIICF